MGLDLNFSPSKSGAEEVNTLRAIQKSDAMGLLVKAEEEAKIVSSELQEEG